jgi:hypothetical protein
MYRLLPSFLKFLVKNKVERLYKYGAMTVRDAQHAVLNLGYSKEDLLRNCPKAPEGVEVDPSIRRMKAVFTHPIGDYAVQPREATFAAHGVTQAHYLNGGAYTGERLSKLVQLVKLLVLVTHSNHFASSFQLEQLKTFLFALPARVVPLEERC